MLKKYTEEQHNFTALTEDDWICRDHGSPNAFYCFKHSIPYCPEESELHSACTGETCALGKLRELVTKLAEIKIGSVDLEKKAVLESQAILDALKLKSEKEQESHKKLYSIIDTSIKKKIADTSKETEETDLKVLSDITSEKEKSVQNVTEYDAAISEIKNNTPDRTGSTTMKALVEKYMKIWLTHNNAPKDYPSEIKQQIIQIEKDQKNANIPYEEKKVDASLSVAFDKIHHKGFKINCQQCTSDILCTLSPLASTFSIFDLATHIVDTRELYLKNERFNAPYGVAAVHYLGRLFLTGGSRNLIDSLNECYEYSFLKEELIPRGNMICERSEHSMIVFDEQIFCVGGHAKGEQLASCEKCLVGLKNLKGEELINLLEHKGDKVLYKWLNLKPMSEAKCCVSLCSSIEEGRIYAFGGLDNEKPLGTIEFIDATDINSSWEKVGTITNLVKYHMGCIKAKFGDNVGFLLFGGITDKNEASKDTYFLIKDFGGKDKFDAIRVKGCDLGENEDFCNRQPIKRNDGNDIFVAGKFTHYMIRMNEKEPKWVTLTESNYDSF